MMRTLKGVAHIEYVDQCHLFNWDFDGMTFLSLTLILQRKDVVVANKRCYNVYEVDTCFFVGDGVVILDGVASIMAICKH